MRPIDADALMEQSVWFCGGWVGDSYAEGYMDALDKVEETIKSAPTIDIMQKWIPCDERLPETTDAVLTTYIVNGDKRRRYVEESSYYVNDESWCSPWDEYRIDGTRIEVIAWMPLPKPYDGERNDNENN